ncbi:MAG TPA: redoxin domain-containing protein [Abditibacterium sp.]
MFKFQNGDAAPDFTLLDCLGTPWTLSAQKPRMVCLYFARGEYCPTTRGEFANFNGYSRLFPKMNCSFAFVVNGGREPHAKFAREFRMSLPILIDETGEIGDKYGIYGVNHNDLRRDDYKNYVAPGVYVIDGEGEINAFWLASAPRGLPSPECILGILGYAEHNGGKY